MAVSLGWDYSALIVAGIHLPEGDTHFAEQIAANPLYRGKGTYQWNKLAAALEVCGERRGHAVDVGAHVGLWSRVLSYEFKRVTAFEPIEEYAACFRRNLMFRSVKLHKFALANYVGTDKFQISSDGVGTASLDPLGSLEVAVHVLDDEELSPIDFLKIDCEGTEALVIAGGEQTIRRDKPVVLVEQKPKRADSHGLPRMDAVNLLLSWGAEHVSEMKGDHLLRWPA